MAHRYLPMLRSKAGEAIALTNLTRNAKSRLMPVIHMVHKPPATFADSIVGAWSGRPMALDGTFSLETTGTAAAFTQMFNHLGRGKVAVIPSIEYGADPAYLAGVQKVQSVYASGLVVKAKPNRLHDVENWVVAQGWSTNDVDLVVTLGEIGGYDADMLAPVVIKAINDNVPDPSRWRTVVLSASAAPKDVGSLVAGRNLVPRLDWRTWERVQANVPHQIDYADFSTTTPDLTDPPGYVMSKATVSVRYTIDDYWIVLKGRPTTGKSGQKMTPQYQTHAKTLVADPAFGGLIGCWGDDRIQKIVSGAAKAGARPLWASIAASRHLSFVADRLP